MVNSIHSLFNFLCNLGANSDFLQILSNSSTTEGTCLGRTYHLNTKNDPPIPADQGRGEDLLKHLSSPRHRSRTENRGASEFLTREGHITCGWRVDLWSSQKKKKQRCFVGSFCEKLVGFARKWCLGVFWSSRHYDSNVFNAPDGYSCYDFSGFNRDKWHRGWVSRVLL